MGLEAAAAAEGCLPRLEALPRVIFLPVSSVSAFRSGGSQSFYPLFCHHFFPADEKIVGFDSLLIKLFFIPTTFDLYVHLDGVVSPKAQSPKTIRSNLMHALLKQVPFPGHVCSTPHAFEQKIRESANFRPPGRVRSQTVLQQAYSSSSSSSSKLLLQIRECIFSATESGKEFAALHRRVEWFLHWFIESASSIHPDPQWLVLLPYLCYLPAGNPNGGRHGGPEGALEWGLLDKAKDRVREMRSRAEPSGCLVGPPLTAEDSEDAGPFSALPGGGEVEGSYELAGLVTLYTFYGLSGYRRRLSQCLVFPHVQSKGIGMQTLEFVYQDIILDPQVIEFTVEDPATSFSQLRDVVCLKLAVDLGIVSSQMLYPPPPPLEDEACEGSTAPAAAAAAAAAAAVSPAQAHAAAIRDGAAAVHSAAPGYPCTECLRRLLKETKLQAIRLSEILALAAVLPADTPQPPLDASAFSSRRDWRQSELSPPLADDSSQQQQQQQEQQQGEETPAGQGLGGALKRPTAVGSANLPPSRSMYRAAASKPSPAKRAAGPPSSGGFHEGTACAAVRLQVKRRLKRENYEVLSELPLQQQKAELDKRWAETYAKYFRTIMKLRRLTAPRPAAVEEETQGDRPRRRQRRGSVNNS
ncbi:hypothetical protein Esti_000583 [Eimeria stiedai]